MFACGIWNSAQGIRNPASDCKPKSSIHRQEIPNPAPESRIQVDLPYTWRENYVISEIKGRGGGGGGYGAGRGAILTNSPETPRLPTTPTNPGIPCLLIKNIFFFKSTKERNEDSLWALIKANINVRGNPCLKTPSNSYSAFFGSPKTV